MNTIKRIGKIKYLLGLNANAVDSRSNIVLNLEMYNAKNPIPNSHQSVFHCTKLIRVRSVNILFKFR